MSRQLSFDENILGEISHKGLYETVISYFPYIEPVIQKDYERMGSPVNLSYVNILVMNYIIMKRYNKDELADFLKIDTRYSEARYDQVYLATIHWINDNEELLQLRML
ncbi:hypothetical protein KAU11_09675 [Candidatus Babeliales bacterium]|nr:hypothetical protein [Candidatus Babeliales bacterium]